jgi:type IV pilus assembly protein PilW
MATMMKNKLPGFTLVELLVAMLISMFLLGGIMTVYVNSQDAYKARHQMSLVEDNGRAALQSLIDYIEHTAYGSPQGVSLDSYFPRQFDDGLCADNASNITDPNLLRLTADGVLANDTDTLTSAYASDDPADNLTNINIRRDCTGTFLRDECRFGNAINQSATLIYNSFYIQSSDAGIPQLICAGSVGNAPLPLADGIENMQFLYGVDNDGDRQHDRFMRADDINATPEIWNNVVSVKVALLVRAPIATKDQAIPFTYQLLDESVQTNDRFQRSVFMAEISLRNAQL